MGQSIKYSPVDCCLHTSSDTFYVYKQILVVPLHFWRYDLCFSVWQVSRFLCFHALCSGGEVSKSSIYRGVTFKLRLIMIIWGSLQPQPLSTSALLYAVIGQIGTFDNHVKSGVRTFLNQDQQPFITHLINKGQCELLAFCRNVVSLFFCSPMNVTCCVLWCFHVSVLFFGPLCCFLINHHH